MADQERQLLRKRASGSVRPEEPRSESQATVVVNTVPGTLTSQVTGRDEKHVTQETSSPLETRPANGKDIGRGAVTTWLSSTFWIAVAAVIFSISVFGLLRNVGLPALKSVLDGPQGTEEGFGIALHPQDHIYRPAEIVERWWSINTGFRAPDGVKKRVYLINGSFPGPTIEVRSGDTLRIHVTNDIQEDEGLSIHWHGLNMKGSNEMDGAVGLTQCPITKGKHFTYEFRIDDAQSGTFWYHAHSQVQRADGLYGGLVVHRPVSPEPEAESTQYDYLAEVLLLIGDWYHRSAEEVLAWYLNSRSFGNEPVPDSLLVNGLGHFDCSMAAPARPLDCKATIAPKLVLNDSLPVRFRVVNTGSLAGFTFGIKNAKICAVQVDGGNEIDAEEADTIGTVYPGERVDVVARWNSGAPHESTGLMVSLDEEDFNYPNPSLESEQNFPIDIRSKYHPHSVRNRVREEEDVSNFDLQSSQSRHQLPILSTNPQTIVLYTTTMKLAKFSNKPKGFMNHTSWQAQSSPNLPLLALPRSSWDVNQLIPWIPPVDPKSGQAQWVDIVLNNLDDGGHPFHLHGHDFYVLSTYKTVRGWGSFNPFELSADEAPGGPYDLDRPLKRDTVFVPRRGYAVLRFRADNPGIWMFHCHILWHQASGMAMGFQVGGPEEGFAEVYGGPSGVLEQLCAVQ